VQLLSGFRGTCIGTVRIWVGISEHALDSASYNLAQAYNKLSLSE